MMKRLRANLFTGSWHARRALSKDAQERITEAVTSAERRTSAQIKVVVETSLGVTDIYRGKTARDRALEVFGHERVWDTEANNGILLYLLLSERNAEIVVDRGLSKMVQDSSWGEVCSIIERATPSLGLGEALVSAVRTLGEIASEYFPPTTGANELSDEVTVR